MLVSGSSAPPGQFVPPAAVPFHVIVAVTELGSAALLALGTVTCTIGMSAMSILCSRIRCSRRSSGPSKSRFGAARATGGSAGGV